MKTSTAKVLQIASLVRHTEAEGPGLRWALWFQGCPLRCPGCCNPEMLPFSGGKETPVEDLVENLARAKQERPELVGITLLGGEPTSHAAGAVPLAEHARALGLSVMIFSGFTLETLRESPDIDIRKLLHLTDILVDGSYDQTKPEIDGRRWIGSTNQKVYFLRTDIHQPDDPEWKKKNTIEIRIGGGEMLINGFPAKQARSIWKKLL
jgi:anaerobic ribonucleoside-triphosphate reductase activating protein